jgi:cytochrome P450
MAIFTFTNVTVSLISLYIARRVYWETTTGNRLRALAKQAGALPATPRVSRLPFAIPTFGIEIIISQLRAFKGKRFLEHWRQVLANSNAHTISMTMLGSTCFLTDDPENIKALLATKFNDYSLGKERIDELSSYLGYGIFTNEGKAWKHSREMLRPCFERSQVADISVFERHTASLIKLLPTDGSTVDLQPLFHELTLDVATEFLFGRSTNSLDRGESSEEVRDFIEAFERCIESGIDSENFKKYGWVGLFLPDKKRKRSMKMIQGNNISSLDQLGRLTRSRLCRQNH